MENEAPPQKYPGFPWKTLAQNVGVIGGAHFAGRMAGGLAVKVLAGSPLGRKYVNLPPEAQRQLARRVGDASAVGAALTLRAQDLASQMRMEDALHERMRKLESRMEKKASVHRAYAAALRTL